MPNPELIALLTCDATATDPSGKVTLYGVFDVIWTERFPMRHPQFSLFCKCRFAAPGVAHLRIDDPEGDTLLTLDPIAARVPGNVQAIYNFPAFEFGIAGEYTIALAGPDGAVGNVSLEVRMRQ